MTEKLSDDDYALYQAREMREKSFGETKARGPTLPCFTEESYHRLLAVLNDNDNWPISLDVYLRMQREKLAEDGFRRHDCEYIGVDVDGLIAWCARLGVPVDNRRLAMYVRTCVIERDARIGRMKVQQIAREARR